MPENYIQSIQYKLKVAKYHHDAALSALGNHAFWLTGLGDQKEPAILACSAEFTAMMITLQSCLDILAQLINSKTKSLETWKVTFNVLLENIYDHSLKTELELLQSRSIYLDDFCNVTKHRNIIGVYSQYSVATMVPMEFLMIQEFSRKGRYHHERELTQVMRNTFDVLSNQIQEIVQMAERLGN